MRFVVPLLLIASVAMPSIGHAKTAKPHAARVARAARPVVHANQLVGAAWVAPAASGLMAAAVAGVAASNGGLRSSGNPAPFPATGAAPTVSPE